VESRSGLAHSAVVTAANVHDKHPLPDLLHGNERRVYGDSAYSSQQDLIASKAPHAKDFTNVRVRNRLGEVDEVARSKNRNKSRVRARVDMCSGWSSGCGASAKSVTEALPRTPRGRLPRWPWPTFTWPEDP